MRANHIITSTPSWVWCLLLFALALTVRLLHLTGTYIAGDEPFSIFIAQYEPSFIVEYLSQGNNPPLFELILHYWMNWVGDSDHQLRLLPALFSALTVIPIFLVGKRHLNSTAGIIASLLFTFSIQHIRFAHEIRVYSFLALLSASSILFFLAVVKNPKNTRGWLLLGISWVLMMYSHYLMIFPIATQLILGAITISKSHFKFAAATILLFLVAYIPNLYVIARRVGFVASKGGTWVEPPGWGEIYGSINLMLNTRVMTAGLIVLVFIGLFLNRKQLKSILSESSLKFPVLIVLLFAIPYLSQFLISKFYLPIFTDRYILYSSAPLYLSVSVVLYIAWSTFSRYLVSGVLIIGLSLWTTDFNPSNHRDVGAVVKKVQEWRTDSQLVYVLPMEFDLAFAYHYNKEWFETLGSNKYPKDAMHHAMRSGGVYPVTEVDQLLDSVPNQFICVDAHSDFLHPGNGILNQLKSEYYLVDSVHCHQIFDIYLLESR
jgi:uncharacterized membrane protein